jgi:hypothetical protein
MLSLSMEDGQTVYIWPKANFRSVTLSNATNRHYINILTMKNDCNIKTVYDPTKASIDQ